MLRCGLLGGKLGHSYSPRIHAMLGDYEYRLYEKAPAELESFLLRGDWDGLNVTIPYKKSVLRYCSALSETAAHTGSVNTLLRLPGGRIYGENTDVFGFEALLRHAGYEARGKRAAVLGNGGGAAAVCEALRRQGTAEVITLCRGSEYFSDPSLLGDIQLVINATPVGMYPNNGAAAIELRALRGCEFAADLIYNPARSALLLEAERLGIPCADGLYMLSAQAKRSSEIFTGTELDDGLIDRVERTLRREERNVILIGMPGCGKSSMARLLGEALGRRVYDSDDEIVRAAGCDIPAIFARGGEEEFRSLETQTLRELGKLSGAVIATGGGCVTREENYPLLHQNGVLIWLRRGLEKLPTDGRPISMSADLGGLYARRAPLYARWADHTVSNDAAPENTLRELLAVLET